MRTLIDTILHRCQTLKIQDAEMRAVDASAVEVTVLHILRGLADSYDWESFMVVGDPLFVTQPGVRQYALPEDFQRFLLPAQEGTDGLFLHNGMAGTRLTYQPAGTFRRNWTLPMTTGIPQYYTLVSGPAVQFDCAPDVNGDVGYYTGVGTYIRTITPADLDGNVPLLFPSPLVEMTVSALAIDHSHAQTPTLMAQGEQARSRLINAHRRLSQQFRPEASRIMPTHSVERG